jgi:glutamyl-tRNA reductase
VLRQLQDMGSKEAARRLIDHCSALRQQVLAQVRREGLTDQAILEIERALERMQGRLIHAPLDTLKQAAREGDGDEAAAWVSRLFRLEASLGGEAEKAVQKKSCKQDPPPSSSGASVVQKSEKTETTA